jgi:hypothetical protein
MQDDFPEEKEDNPDNQDNQEEKTNSDVDSIKEKENALIVAKIKEFEKIKKEFGYETTTNIYFLKILRDYLKEMGVNSIGDFNEDFFNLYTNTKAEAEAEEKQRKILEEEKQRKILEEEKKRQEEAERQKLAEEEKKRQEEAEERQKREEEKKRQEAEERQKREEAERQRKQEEEKQRLAEAERQKREAEIKVNCNAYNYEFDSELSEVVTNFLEIDFRKFKTKSHILQLKTLHPDTNLYCKHMAGVKTSFLNELRDKYDKISMFSNPSMDIPDFLKRIEYHPVYLYYNKLYKKKFERLAKDLEEAKAKDLEEAKKKRKI